jgi:hypothetical protein
MDVLKTTLRHPPVVRMARVAVFARCLLDLPRLRGNTRSQEATPAQLAWQLAWTGTSTRHDCDSPHAFLHAVRAARVQSCPL